MFDHGIKGSRGDLWSRLSRLPALIPVVADFFPVIVSSTRYIIYVTLTELGFLQFGALEIDDNATRRRSRWN